MPNGKGQIDCCYCKHFGGPRGYPDGLGVSVVCRYHNVLLPAPEPSYSNRVCCHFEPDVTYWRDNGFWSPPAWRFARFGRDLLPGVLYQFGYNTPDQIEREIVLRSPDYSSLKWKEHDENG